MSSDFWLKEDLSHEGRARSSREEELVRLREELTRLWEKLGKKGSEMLKDSELHQRESALLAAQQALEEACQRADNAKATLRSERDAFEEAIECLNDDLGRTQIALNEAEAREQEAIVDCQRTLKVFKFKYKERYEDEKRGTSPKYSFDIGSFLKREGQDPFEGGAAHVAEVEASQNPPSRDAAPMISGLLSIAFDAERVADVFSVMVGKTFSNTPPGNAAPPTTSHPLAVLDAGQVTQAAVEETFLPTSSEAFRKGKGQVSD